MDDIYNQVYRKDYFEGYENGLNPFVQLLSCKQKSLAFTSGFTNGRTEYENINGLVINGIPERIVTDKILEEFLLAGILGMKIDAEGYTDTQLQAIQKWYESGIEKYDPNQNIYLLALLEKNGITLS
ncbi:hypothetical protein ACFQZF_06465 [Flavobacterium myungsuense]|uniref:Uncharacterized protein n=1 Tax=Flavobacterium myungsuense TaxID=651823 RepID=A0ABW3J2P6_9FLAO